MNNDIIRLSDQGKSILYICLLYTSWIASFGTAVVLMLVAVTMLHLRHSKAVKAQA